jgi:hypothetical protein
MADKTETLATVGKKPRRAPVRRPIELAVVVRVTDGDGQPISGGQVEILMASKDISERRRKTRTSTWSGKPQNDRHVSTFRHRATPSQEGVVRRA